MPSASSPDSALPTVLAMLKAPRSGSVKTRLGKEIGFHEATRVYRLLVERQLAAVPSTWPVEIHFTPADGEAEMRGWLGSSPHYLPQCPGDLGQRLNHAVAEAFKHGAPAVIVVGGDCPELDTATLYHAQALLRTVDVVLGPALDGGYTLIALHRPEPRLFMDIPWSTSTVFETTLARIAELGLTHSLLDPMEDIDDLESLRRFLTRSAHSKNPFPLMSPGPTDSSQADFLLPTELGETSNDTVRSYLVARRLATADEQVTLEHAGPGNMNRVWRVRLPGRSLILKQARPWVEKFPTIAAPVERAEAEASFYHLARQNPVLAARLPELLDHDARAHILVLSDLAPNGSAPTINPSALDAAQLDDLALWLRELHHLKIPPQQAVQFQNRSMRVLNHAHIFDLPLRPAGVFDEILDKITPGLADTARTFRADSDFVARVTALGQRYLHQDCPTLIHGDLFPGSLLPASDGRIMIIDPEFSFGGDPEFDIGVFHAHLVLNGRSEEIRAHWLGQTIPRGGYSHDLAQAYSGVEIMRRLIGIAQLTLALTLSEKQALLEKSRRLVMGRDS